MILSEEEKKIVAYHESGHTLVGLMTEGAHPIEQVTMIPRGHALGLVLVAFRERDVSVIRWSV
jgi:ATP-dependent Zn protease